MTGQTLKLEIKINYPIFLGIACFAHILLFILLQAPSWSQEKLVSQVKRNPIKIHSLGEKMRIETVAFTLSLKNLPLKS
jgi:hypothetical protein